jgi:hypothetical protein
MQRFLSQLRMRLNLQNILLTVLLAAAAFTWWRAWGHGADLRHLQRQAEIYERAHGFEQHFNQVLGGLDVDRPNDRAAFEVLQTLAGEAHDSQRLGTYLDRFNVVCLNVNAQGQSDDDTAVIALMERNQLVDVFVHQTKLKGETVMAELSDVDNDGVSDLILSVHYQFSPSADQRLVYDFSRMKFNRRRDWELKRSAP